MFSGPVRRAPALRRKRGGLAAWSCRMGRLWRQAGGGREKPGPYPGRASITLLQFLLQKGKMSIRDSESIRQDEGDPHPPRPYAGETTSPTQQITAPETHFNSFRLEIQGDSYGLCVSFGGAGILSLRRFCRLSWTTPGKWGGVPDTPPQGVHGSQPSQTKS